MFSSTNPSHTASVGSVSKLNQLCRKEIHNAVYVLGLGSFGTFLIRSQLHAVNKMFMNIKQTATPNSRHGPKLSTTAAHVASSDFISSERSDAMLLHCLPHHQLTVHGHKEAYPRQGMILQELALRDNNRKFPVLIPREAMDDN
jgi:hypothetical protein